MVTELEERLAAAGRRWFLWNLVRAGAASLGVWAAVAYLGGDALWHSLSVICFGMAWVLRPSVSEVPALIDQAGDLDGLIECAYDNRHRASPTVEAQRKRALEAARSVPISSYVPTPSVSWALPVALWGCAIAVVPEAQTWVVSAEVSVPGDQRPGVTDGAQEQQPSTEPVRDGSDQRDRVQERRAEDTAQEPPVAGVGRKTGDTHGGDSGRTQVPRYENADGSIQWAEPSAVRARSSQTSEDAIAEPARPFPPKYQSVIADWFNRSVQ